MKTSIGLALLLSLSLATGCGDDGGTPGSDSGMDTGTEMDSGTTDAGADSSTETDAGSDTTTGTDAGADTGADAGERLSTGMTCDANSDCESGICWNFNERDNLCDGKVCSIGCTSDPQCQEAAQAAGADTPASATCGDDEECNFVGSGLGVFACG